MRNHRLDSGNGRAFKTQQALPDLQIVHFADIDVVGLEQIEDVAHITRIGIFKGNHAVSDAAGFHRVENLFKGGKGDRLFAGEEHLLRRVRVRSFRAEIAHHRRMNQCGLVVLGKTHFVADELFVIGQVAHLLDVGAVLFDDHFFARRVEDGHLVGGFIARDQLDRFHALAEKLGHLLIHFVDGQPCLLQIRHL